MKQQEQLYRAAMPMNMVYFKHNLQCFSLSVSRATHKSPWLLYQIPF